MTSPLPALAHEHHERLMHQIDRMPALGDSVGVAAPADLARAVDELTAFLEGTLVPHIAAAERTLYPELERLLQNQHSMKPMRREHDEVRRLIAELAAVRPGLEVRQPSIRTIVAVRRAVFGLYALLKVHLAEEELYLTLVEHGVSDEAAATLATAMDHPMVVSA
ncbi:MAG: hemerythrin domain-containing protein [Chloroflexota bacterium]